MSSVLVIAEGVHAQGKENDVGKKRKPAPTCNDNTGNKTV